MVFNGLGFSTWGINSNSSASIHPHSNSRIWVRTKGPIQGSWWEAWSCSLSFDKFRLLYSAFASWRREGYVCWAWPHEWLLWGPIGHPSLLRWWHRLSCIRVCQVFNNHSYFLSTHPFLAISICVVDTFSNHLPRLLTSSQCRRTRVVFLFVLNLSVGCSWDLLRILGGDYGWFNLFPDSSALIFATHQCDWCILWCRKVGWSRRARVVQASLKNKKGVAKATPDILTWKKLDDARMSKIDLQTLYDASAKRGIFGAKGGPMMSPILLILLTLVITTCSSCLFNSLYAKCRRKVGVDEYSRVTEDIPLENTYPIDSDNSDDDWWAGFRFR